MVAPLLIIAAGGTGGHMFPAQALAEVMLVRGWRVKLSTDARGRRYAGGFPDAVEIEEVASATFARGGLFAKIAVPFRILGGVIAASFGMMRDKPAVVVGFGGYPSIPAIGAAWLMRRPRMIHEQNGVLGRVNRLFARRVNLVACGTEPTKLPANIESVFTGNPVREAILARAGAPYTPPSFGPVRIVVIGGSQGARILSELVPPAIEALPENLRFRINVVQQARAEDLIAVRALYKQFDCEAEVSEFIDDVPDQLAQAQLVISRAGASSVSEIATVGRPSILIPYAAATGDHQTANAKALEAGGAAIVVQERDLDMEALSLHIMHILNDETIAEDMARAAATISKPRAAHELAMLVEALKDK